MSYASIADIRSEGLSAARLSDSRAQSLLDEASSLIDVVTGWWFEPRGKTYVMSGRGSQYLEFRVPPIEIVSIVLDGDSLSVTAPDMLMVSTQIDRVPTRLWHSKVFRKAKDNVIVVGTFGRMEPGSGQTSRTPLGIRRACCMLVNIWSAQLGTSDADDARDRWRVLEERTRDQSYKLDVRRGALSLTGNPEVDEVLLPYCRPPSMGAT